MRFDRAAAAENVERIDHDRAGRMLRALDDFERRFDRVELLDEPEELHRRQCARRFADFQQFAITPRAQRHIRTPRRRSGDDMPRAKLRRLFEPPPAFRLDPRPVGIRRIEPSAEINHRRHREPALIERAAQFRERAARRDMRVHIGKPQLDRAIARECRHLDLARDGRPANRARIQTIAEGRHAPMLRDGVVGDREKNFTRDIVIPGTVIAAGYLHAPEHPARCPAKVRSPCRLTASPKPAVSAVFSDSAPIGAAATCLVQPPTHPIYDLFQSPPPPRFRRARPHRRTAFRRQRHLDVERRHERRLERRWQFRAERPCPGRLPQQWQRRRGHLRRRDQRLRLWLTR